jgi:hypothetical protein
MGQKIVIGPINKGIQTNKTAFNIDNDSFPVLLNAYQWRGRVKRKRGTNNQLGRLQRQITISVQLTLNAGQDAILPNFPIVPGSINLTGSLDGTVYTDPNINGTLTATGGTGTGGTINYATGSIHINAGGGEFLNGTINYYPTLPVMGLEDLALQPTQFPGTLAFDTKYSYNIPTTSPYQNYDVTFYKNPPTDATNLPNYVPKTTQTRFTWNGQNYQQFWTTNYENALWETNGITIPFSITNIGMQFKPILPPSGGGTGVTIIQNGPAPPAIANLNITAHGLVVGDFVFVNEVVGIVGINFQTGYVTTVTDANNVQVTFPFATLSGAYISGGIAQYLTNTSDATKDTLRWYDGDPTNAGVPATTGPGWVNFSPPLSQFNYSIANTPQRQWYLIGARIILPFKDRLLFFGPVIQNSSAGSQIYLPDTVIYSQNGTPYYTVSYTNNPNAAVDNPVSPTIAFHPMLLPTNQTATASAWFEDQTGFGGFIQAGVDQPLTTIGFNEDVIICGFSTIQTRLVYSGSDLNPFIFFIINAELGSASTFSAVTLDEGVMSHGTRGFIITGQTYSKRFDLDIPEQVFQINLVSNGNERVCSQRDFLNEWIYFTYPSNIGDNTNAIFPNQTLQYNYRDQTWAIFNESYTTYGTFRKSTGNTWLTTGFASWNAWTESWVSGEETLLQPEIIAGNQQGFIMLRDQGTEEGTSLFIQSISGSVITSPDHGLNDGDYIVISGVIGTIGPFINGKVFSVGPLLTENTFSLNPLLTGTGTYLGGGLITRMYVPLIKTKQFPLAWDAGRKTRIGVQQSLFSTTPAGQVQILIFLSQDDDNPYNSGPIVPSLLSTNNTLIYSQTMFTCPESTNLGLTPFNINLQIPTAITQQQTWHRMNTSLIGDTVQLGITMSDAQMRDPNLIVQFSEIEFHGCILDCSPSQLLV